MSIVNMIEENIKKWISSLSISQKAAFISAMIIGFIAHGFVFFNRLSVHDNSHCLFTLGATYEVNRWGLGIIYKLQLLTTKTYSLPWLNGLASIIFVACAAMVIIKTFDVKSKLVGAYIGALMVAFPMITSLFSFMFTSWPYCMGLLIATIAAYTLTRELTIKNLIFSALWLSLCLGLYQAFLGVVIIIFLLKMFIDVIENRTESVLDYGKQGVAYFVELGLGLGLWAVIGKFFRAVQHIELETYKGWDEGYNLAKFPTTLLNALKSFFGFRMEGINALKYLRALALLIFVITIIMMIALFIKSEAKVSVRIASLVGIAFMPVAMVIVYLLSTSELYEVSTLMVYPEVFVYIIPLILLERFDTSKIISAVLVAAVTVVTFGYVSLDNAAYYKAAIYQEQAIAYTTALLANIKSTTGFSDDMEIVMVGFNDVADKTINEVTTGRDEMGGIQLEKYYNSLDEMLNKGVNIQFLRDHLGVGNENLRIEDPTQDTSVSGMNEVKAMPTYPNEGSIAIIDNMVVVKMGE